MPLIFRLGTHPDGGRGGGQVSNADGIGGLAHARRHSMDNMLKAGGAGAPAGVGASKAGAPLPTSAPIQLSDAAQFPALGGRVVAPAPWRGGRNQDESFTAPTTPTSTPGPTSQAPTASQVVAARVQSADSTE